MCFCLVGADMPFMSQVQIEGLIDLPSNPVLMYSKCCIYAKLMIGFGSCTRSAIPGSMEVGILLSWES